MIVCIVAILISGYQLYNIFSEYAEGKALYEDTAQQYTAAVDQDNSEEESADAESDEAAAPPISVDFDALLEENSDVVGWLYCEDTVINYPILQAEDNDTYLRYMIDGTYNSAGSIFMDYRCSSDFSSVNTILYGHNMKNDTMFGTLTDYNEQSYYDSHPILWLLTPEGDYRIDLIAGYVLAADSELYQTISDQELLTSCISQALSQSTFRSTAEYAETDKIITLSTCSYEYDEARYALIGVLVSVE